MKRYRVLRFDWDTRATVLALDTTNFAPEALALHVENVADIRQGIIAQYGTLNADQKLANFTALGPLPISVLSFHNKFHQQARQAFVADGYYAALTGICALGERVLNHLVLRLRDFYKRTPEYKKVYRKDTFDDWDLAIDTLEAWDVLLPDVAQEYRALRRFRNDAIHFRPEVDTNERALALDALHAFADIVIGQFSAFGAQPWFIENVRGASYIKKGWETNPFIRLVYLPAAVLVGPYHQVELTDAGVWNVHEFHRYDEIEITDEEFARLLEQGPPRPHGR